jgi:hypothetical protein
VCDKYGNAVSNRHGHPGSALERKVSIAVAASEPPFPPGSVSDDVVSMNLVRDG